MGSRVRGVLIVAVVLVTGAFMGSALAQWWNAPITVPAIPGEFHRFGVNERVRVEVLNGGGRTNMARAATEELRAAGFDVVYWGNASTFEQDSSVVLSRAGEVDYARAVADALGIREVRVQPDSNLYLDVSVVLGSVWEPAVEPMDEPGDRAWWDPRNWLRRPGTTGEKERLADPGEDGGSD